jgi:hypothetical protein
MQRTAMSQGQMPGSVLIGGPLIGDAPVVTKPDPLDQIKKLAELRDSGILTDEEFATQKARLLNS